MLKTTFQKTISIKKHWNFRKIPLDIIINIIYNITVQSFVLVMWRVGPVRQGTVNHVRRVNRAALSGQSCAPQSAYRHMTKKKLFNFWIRGERIMYQALYRKWRPKSFSDVYGQPHVTRTLQSQLESGRISHAYLFTGSRGTGKTTCAKILSKAVNCLNPVDGNPCNECEICRVLVTWGWP